MDLRIVIDDLDPPMGRALVDQREAWTFVGWLELMQTLEQLENGHATTGTEERSTS